MLRRTLRRVRALPGRGLIRAAEWRRGIPRAEPGELSPAELPGLLGAGDLVVFEIGANAGQHTACFADLLPGATIHAFEPDPEAFAALETVAAGLPNVRAAHAAVSDADGTATFHVSSAAPGGDAGNGTGEPKDPLAGRLSGSLCEPTGHLTSFPWVKFETAVEVPTRSLDSYCREAGVGRIDFIWMDVQGAERLVLEGAAETLRRVRFLYTEYFDVELYAGQPGLAEILDLCPGFRVRQRFGTDVLLENPAAVAAPAVADGGGGG